MDALMAWLIAIGGGALLIAAYYVRCRTIELQKFERHASRFFEHAKPLLADDEVPLSILDTIQFLNRHIDDRSFGRHFVWSLLRRRRPIFSKEAQAEIDEALSFFERRKELQAPFSDACAEALIATTYRSGLAGLLLRRLVLFDVSRNKRRSSEIAFSIRDCDGNGHGVAQAA